MAPPPSPSPHNTPRVGLDDLLAQADWMRTLARALVAGPGAEDLEQDAWVAALGARQGLHGDLRAWLRTVMRRLAVRRQARERRRPEVEALAARPEVTGEMRQAVERMELQQWLARALLALEEPLRSAVILRHLEGLDAAAIGARQECSRAAARQRVARGLARLRAALDEEHGERRAWGRLLAPWAAAPSADAPSAPSPLPLALGGTLVGSKLLLGSVAALAAVSLVLWVARGGRTERARTLRAPALADAPPLRAAPEPRSADPAPVAGREAAPPSAPAAQVSAPGPTPGGEVRLAVRVLDAERQPVPGAEIVLQRPELGHFSVLDLELSHRPEEVTRGRTDAAGRLAVEVEPGIPFDVLVSAAGFCDQRLTRRQAGQHEVVLTPGFQVHGTVTRARDGAPVVDARVRVFRMGVANSQLESTTDARGRYALRFPFEADAVLEVLAGDLQGSDWIRLTPGPDGRVQQDLALEDGIEVRGRVVDADDGEPIAGARIGEGWTFRRSVLSDADGGYRFRGFGQNGVLELHVRADGYGKSQRTNLPPASEGVMTVDFALQRGRVVRGRLLDPDGFPVAGAYVGAVGNDTGLDAQRYDWLSTRSDPRGRFEISGLIPDLRHCLIASARGLATSVLDLPAAELETPELELGDLWLTAPALLAGTVVDQAGGPVAGITVELTGSDRGRGRLRADAVLPPAAGWYVDRRTGVSDAHGRFAFGALAAGDYVLTALRDGRPPSRRVQVALDTGARNEDVVLTFATGEALRGRVLDEDGGGLEGVYVGATLQRRRRPSAGAAPRSRLSAGTGPDGAFAFEDLPPGTYELSFQPFATPASGDAPWLETSREAVETGGRALEVQLPRGRWIQGRLLDANGAALVGHVVVGSCATSERSPSSTADEGGAFALAVEPGTVWDLEVHGPYPGESWRTVFHTEYAIAAGTQGLEVVADVPSAGLPDDR